MCASSKSVWENWFYAIFLNWFTILQKWHPKTSNKNGQKGINNFFFHQLQLIWTMDSPNNYICELICHSHKNLKNYCSKFSFFILYVFWTHYFHLTPHLHNYSPISHAIKIFWFFSHFFSRSFGSSDLLYFLNFFKKFLFIKSRNHCLFVYGFNILKNKS